MPHQLGSRVRLDHVLVDLLGQPVLCKLGEGTAEGRLAWNLTGTFPAAELPQQRPGLERVNERTGGGELIDVLGDEGMRQPDPLVRRTAVAAPFITAGETAHIGEHNHFAELLIQRAQRTEFGRECGEKLPLQVVEDRRQVSHVFQTPQPSSRSNKSIINPNKIRF